MPFATARLISEYETNSYAASACTSLFTRTKQRNSRRYGIPVILRPQPYDTRDELRYFNLFAMMRGNHAPDLWLFMANTGFITAAAGIKAIQKR